LEPDILHTKFITRFYDDEDEVRADKKICTVQKAKDSASFETGTRSDS
jgi:hypothetical protein